MDAIRIRFTKCGDVFQRFNFSDDTEEEVVFNSLPHSTIQVDVGVTELASSSNLDRGSAWYLGARTRTSNDEPGVQLAIKLATHIEVQPRTEQYEVAQSLKEEALFYSRYLKKLQGRVVPVHFGFWIGRTSWAVRFWNGVAIRGHAGWRSIRMKIGTPRFFFFHRKAFRQTFVRVHRMKFGAAIQALHDADVEHRQLDDRHHLLYNEGSGDVRIVDFTQATGRHVCQRQLPLIRYAACPSEKIMRCDELIQAGKLLGLFGSAPEDQDTDMKRACMFYKRQRALGLSHSLALEAQLQFLLRYRDNHWHRTGQLESLKLTGRPRSCTRHSPVTPEVIDTILKETGVSRRGSNSIRIRSNTFSP
ncbi:uncharacterized protein EV420DRAFT_145897 [Desarmillaria tabescens]|uniref:Protein kinase domain-containing protein n=1 Tax=Armillaria tabescens TaxID=1929756 RepID=A0AA39NAI5_ARMTA|nr:uncharacterized protein EV420DRAFT_145897 [Desarmillaria tabescens]KAK0462070.1 hypothetical protein EV420DRAFT_145897 [Desarmillaria tabescens]